MGKKTGPCPQRKSSASWKKGQSGNPAGRPKGSRHRLTEGFLMELCLDFDKHGKDAIRRVREERPSDYIKAIVQLVPKEHKISILEEVKSMSDDELIDKLRALDEQLGRLNPDSAEIFAH